ncbi:DUF4873 domain-containing protein [Gordonia sp. CPCC 205333]|uniref:DUF4873 domain-containing protein n=1 Tax=Gordonia sp. CPCC 205333 TaxID=3140790 RepID=UPI003AF3C239
MTPAVVLDGRGPVLAELGRRALRAGVPVDIGDPQPGQLVVVEGVAPQPNYLQVCSASEPNRVYCNADTLDYVLALVVEYAAAGATGLRVRQPVLNEWGIVGTRRKLRRRLKRFAPIEFDWDTAESIDSEVFDGEVTFVADGERGIGRIRVQGHLNPSDGRFHWAGTAYGDDVRRWRDEQVREVEITAASGLTAAARLTDVTQWGTVRLVGVGTPPF